MTGKEALRITRIWTTPSEMGRAVGSESDRVDVHLQLNRLMSSAERQVLGQMWHDEDTATDRHLILSVREESSRVDYLEVQGALYDEVVAVFSELRDLIRDSVPEAAIAVHARAVRIRTTVKEQEATVAAEIASEFPVQ